MKFRITCPAHEAPTSENIRLEEVPARFLQEIPLRILGEIDGYTLKEAREISVAAVQSGFFDLNKGQLKNMAENLRALYPDVVCYLDQEGE